MKDEWIATFLLIAAGVLVLKLELDKRAAANVERDRFIADVTADIAQLPGGVQ